jgi:hypothetical protein
MDPMVCEYIEKFNIDNILVKPLCLLCMIIHLNIVFDAVNKQDRNWYKKMITDCLITAAIEVTDILLKESKN